MSAGNRILFVLSIIVALVSLAVMVHGFVNAVAW